MRRRAARERLIRQQEYLSRITAPRFPNVAGKAVAAEWCQAIAANTFREVNRLYAELEPEVKQWVKVDHPDWLAEERAIEEAVATGTITQVMDLCDAHRQRIETYFERLRGAAKGALNEHQDDNRMGDQS
jgi:hypothetical protein